LLEIKRTSEESVPEYPTRSDVISEWYKQRIYYLETCGVVTSALETALIAQEKNVPDLTITIAKLKMFKNFVYRSLDEPIYRLEDFFDLSEEEVLRIFLSRDLSFLCADIKALAIPFLDIKNDGKYRHLFQHLMRQMTEQNSLNVLKFVIFDYVVNFNSENAIKIGFDLIQNFVLECAQFLHFDVIGFNEDIIGKIFDLSKSEIIKPEIHDLKQRIDSILILSSNGFALSLEELKSLQNSFDAQKLLLNKFVRKSSKISPSEKSWSIILEDLIQLKSLEILQLPLIHIYREFLNSALSNLQFNLAKSVCYPAHEESILTDDIIEEVVLNCARDFFDNSDVGTKKSINMRSALLWYFILISALKYFQEVLTQESKKKTYFTLLLYSYKSTNLRTD
jgi:hypothetical protein